MISAAELIDALVSLEDDQPADESAEGVTWRGEILIEQRHGRIVAFIAFERRVGCMFILRVFTVAPYRRQNIARRLVQHVMGLANETRLAVLRDNEPARHLYSSLGFTVLHEREAYLVMTTTTTIATQAEKGAWVTLRTIREKLS
jgi:ribosomal protein S18 acetylase RimI-like enzyme